MTRERDTLPEAAATTDGHTLEGDGMARKKRQPKDWHKVEGHAGLYERANGTYAIRFRYKGVWYSKAAGRKLEEAKATLYDERLRAQRGTTGVRDNAYSLQRLKRQYLDHSARRLAKKTVDGYTDALDRILDGLMAERVCHLGPAIVEEYVAERLRTVSNRTINLELTVLRACLKFGVRQGLTASDPLADFQMLPSKAVKFKRALAAEEFEKLLDHHHSQGGGGRRQRHRMTKPCGAADVWLLLGHTGIRAGELRGLDWPDVDFDGRRLHVRGTKTKASDRWIPMSDRLADMLERRRPEALTGPVFVTTRGTRMKWSLHKRLAECLRAVRMCEAADDEGRLDLDDDDARKRYAEARGIDPHGLTLHSFRYSFATWLIQAGESPKTVQQLLGHSTLEMTLKVYAQVLPGDAVRAIQSLPGEASATDTNGQAKPKPAHNRRTRPRGFLRGIA